MPKSCYMCERPATSKEHVPPQCFFPEGKDLPVGINLRRNLITVPSCEEHNTNKSRNDEYLLFCLLLNIANNDTAFSHFSTKITRAMNLNPKTYQSFIKTNTPVIAVDSNTGNASHTFMFKMNTPRIMKSLDQISHALYYNRYKSRFKGKCKILFDFALYNGPDAVKKNDFLQKALKRMKDYFDNLEHAGENPEVFKYVLQDMDKGHFLGMRFYGGSNIFVAFIP